MSGSGSSYDNWSNDWNNNRSEPSCMSEFAEKAWSTFVWDMLQMLVRDMSWHLHKPLLAVAYGAAPWVVSRMMRQCSKRAPPPQPQEEEHHEEVAAGPTWVDYEAATDPATGWVDWEAARNAIEWQDREPEPEWEWDPAEQSVRFVSCEHRGIDRIVVHYSTIYGRDGVHVDLEFSVPECYQEEAYLEVLVEEFNNLFARYEVEDEQRMWMGTDRSIDWVLAGTMFEWMLQNRIV